MSQPINGTLFEQISYLVTNETKDDAWMETAKSVATYVGTRALGAAGLGMFIAGCVLSGGILPFVIGAVGLGILGVYAAYWVNENRHELQSAVFSVFS